MVGSDKEAVDFVNMCKDFIDRETVVRKEFLNSWLQKLNEFTIKSAVDVSPNFIFLIRQSKMFTYIRTDIHICLTFF